MFGVKDKKLGIGTVNVDFEVVAKVKGAHNAAKTVANPNPTSVSLELVAFERAFEPFKKSFTTTFLKVDFFSKSPFNIPGWDWLTFHCEMNPLSDVTTEGAKIDLKIPITFKAKGTLTEDTAQYAADSDLGGLLKVVDMEVAVGITAFISALDAKALQKLKAAHQKMTKSLDDLVTKAKAVHQKDIELHQQLTALEAEHEDLKGSVDGKKAAHKDVKSNVRRMRKNADQIRDAKKRAAYLKKLDLAEDQLKSVRRKALDALDVVKKCQSKVDELTAKVATKTGKVLSSQANNFFGKYALKFMQKGLFKLIPFVNVVSTLMDAYDLLKLCWEQGAMTAVADMVKRINSPRLKQFIEEFGFEITIGELGVSSIEKLVQQFEKLSQEQFEALLQELKKNPKKINVQDIPKLFEQMIEQLDNPEENTDSNKVEVTVVPCETCDFDNGDTKLIIYQKSEITKVESTDIGGKIYIKRYMDCKLNNDLSVNGILDLYFVVTEQENEDTLLLETDKHFVFEVSYGELSKSFVYYKGNKMKYFPKTGNYEIIK